MSGRDLVAVEDGEGVAGEAVGVEAGVLGDGEQAGGRPRFDGGEAEAAARPIRRRRGLVRSHAGFDEERELGGDHAVGNHAGVGAEDVMARRLRNRQAVDRPPVRG